MALTGSKRDWMSIWSGTSEFDWFWETIEGLIVGDQYGTGPIPMPSPVYVPDTISEQPRSMEELKREQRELEEIIRQQDHGSGDLPPIDEDIWGPIIRTTVPDVVIGDPTDTSTRQQEDDDMAHDWGHLIRGGIQSIFFDDPAPPINSAPGMGFSQQAGAGPVSGGAGGAAGGGGGGDCDGMAWSGGTPPKGYKVVNSCGVGMLRKVRRRRRRRMLTVSDKNDIAAIISMVGKGQLAATLMNRGS